MWNTIKSIFGFNSFSASSQTGLAVQGSWVPIESSSGHAVTAINLMTQSTVYAAIYVLLSSVGNVKFRVVKYLPNGGKKVVRDHPYNDLFGLFANEDIDFRSMLEAIMIHISIRGNAYIQISRNYFYESVALYVLDPTQVQPYRDQDEGGKLYYLVAGVRYDASDIIHIHAPAMDGLVGLSPLNHLRNLAGVAMALDDFSGSFFKNGCNIKGILKVAEELSEQAQNNLRNSFAKVHSGTGNGNNLMILEEGSDFVPTGSTPDEAQFVETQKLVMLKIAQAFNLPPTKLGIYDNTALNTLEESNLDFFNSALLPWIERIIDAFNRKLFTREELRTFAIEHDDNGILKGRKQDLVTVLVDLKNANLISTNEARAELGYEPREGGDELMYQSNNLSPLPGTQTEKPTDENRDLEDEADTGDES